MLISPATDMPPANVKWVADALGRCLAACRRPPTRHSATTIPALRREHALLFNIINAATDPILFTNMEGQLIIANARAEMLFTAPDDVSEGRRRAVQLNNMFFSAALSRTALGEGEAGRRELLLVDPTEGSDLLFELLSTVVSDPREGTGVVSILRNITDLRMATRQIDENYAKLRAAEAEVRAERDRLNLLIDSVADPIIVTDQEGEISLMNNPGRAPVHGGARIGRRRAADRARQRRALHVVRVRPAVDRLGDDAARRDCAHGSEHREAGAGRSARGENAVR